jgi:sugar (pentulose or hexulose) kinase
MPSPSGEQLDDAMATVPPGSDGLSFWPLLSAGVGANPFDRPGGRLAGVGFSHGRNHLLRAVVEGLVCELARHLRQLTDAGIAVERLAMSGAAAASRITPQVLSNVIDCPVACITEASLSAFGASIIARALVEPDVSLVDLSRRLAPASRTVHPDQDGPAYQQLLGAYLGPFASTEKGGAFS